MVVVGGARLSSSPPQAARRSEKHEDGEASHPAILANRRRAPEGPPRPDGRQATAGVLANRARSAALAASSAGLRAPPAPTGACVGWPPSPAPAVAEAGPASRRPAPGAHGRRCGIRCAERGRETERQPREKPALRRRRIRPSSRSRSVVSHETATQACLLPGGLGVEFVPRMKQIYPATITGKGFAEGGSVLDHRFGASEPFTLGVEEEYMLLDPQTYDLVQHVDTVLTAAMDGEFDERVGPELMQSVLEISTPVCKTAGAIEHELRKLRAHVRQAAGSQQPPGRLGGHAPVQPLRAPADHRARPLPEPRRPAPVRRPARADLRLPHPRRRRRRRQGGPRHQRAARPPERAARALGELALLARRADRALLQPPDGLRRVPALGPAAALPRLRGLRGGGRPAREDRLHRRLHAHLVGRPPAPALRDDRGAGDGRDHARRGDGRDHRVRPGARQALLRALRRGQGAPDLPPHPRDREQVARRPLRPRGAGDGPRHRAAEPRARSRS